MGRETSRIEGTMTVREWFRTMRASDLAASRPAVRSLYVRGDGQFEDPPFIGPIVFYDYKDILEFTEGVINLRGVMAWTPARIKSMKWKYLDGITK